MKTYEVEVSTRDFVANGPLNATDEAPELQHTSWRGEASSFEAAREMATKTHRQKYGPKTKPLQARVVQRVP